MAQDCLNPDCLHWKDSIKCDSGIHGPLHSGTVLSVWAERKAHRGFLRGVCRLVPSRQDKSSGNSVLPLYMCYDKVCTYAMPPHSCEKIVTYYSPLKSVVYFSSLPPSLAKIVTSVDWYIEIKRLCLLSSSPCPLSTMLLPGKILGIPKNRDILIKRSWAIDYSI